ncbi:hypothetical protein K502DRAFT_364095 [Neoconidiobolus thromboides FSU 785]|nr:hypothetical protein K502DRAFT_364095 [Neoconidiobolus thromboides FSU 785]
MSKHKLKDKMTYSSWFKNLSKFITDLCIYNDKIDIPFFSQYIMTELYNNSYDSLILKGFITYLSVVKSYTTATKEQLEALSRGIQLRKQAYVLMLDSVATDDITLCFISYLTKSKLLNELTMLLFQCYQKIAYTTIRILM